MVSDGGSPSLLATDRTPLAEAERYGTFFTHPRGHYEVSERWRRLGPASLVQPGLPVLIAWHEYKHSPLGRVVFHTGTPNLTLYADPALQAHAVLHQVLRAFSLDPASCNVRSDPHYRTDVRHL